MFRKIKLVYMEKERKYCLSKEIYWQVSEKRKNCESFFDINFIFLSILENTNYNCIILSYF